MTNIFILFTKKLAKYTFTK